MFLIVGGDSDIGRAVAVALRMEGQMVVGTTRRTNRVGPSSPLLDLANVPVDWEPPAKTSAACIAAAVARLAACAADPEGAAQVNCVGVIEVARRLTQRGIYTLFLSSNQVFDGAAPYVAADTPTVPNTVYGDQKARAESLLRDMMAAGAPVGILRLSKVVFPGLKLFADWCHNLLLGKPVRAFTDMTLAPVPIDFVVRAIRAMTSSRATTVAQLTGPQDITYFVAARHIASLLDADPALVEAGRAVDVGMLAGMTPAHTTLDCEYLRLAHGIEVPPAIQVIESTIRGDASIRQSLPRERLANWCRETNAHA